MLNVNTPIFNNHQPHLGHDSGIPQEGHGFTLLINPGASLSLSIHLNL